jgi:chloramphenicol O-acetyltransferase type A
MRYIDLETWPRRRHFELFGGMDNPHFNITVNVELAAFYRYLKERELSFSVAIIYVLTRAANAIPELRRRIRGKDVVEHDVVHPGVTVMTDRELFNFCYIDYDEDFSRFAAQATERIARAREGLTLESDPAQDDRLYMTAIPWLSFTSFMHATHFTPVDSIPRFAWGKRFEDGGLLKMPLSVQVHHALVDALHVARYYAAVQEYLDDPAKVLTAA